MMTSRDRKRRRRREKEIPTLSKSLFRVLCQLILQFPGNIKIMVLDAGTQPVKTD